MPHEITVDTDAETVKIVYDGELTIDEWRKWRSRAMQACVDHGYTRLLVDQRRAVHQLTTLDLYSFGEEAAAMAPKGLRVARVIAPHDNDSRLVSAIATHHGLSVRDFTSMKAATDWLA